MASICDVVENKVVENKADFVEKFFNLIRDNTREYSDITEMKYVKDKDNEWIYVTYRSGARKRINVTADSCRAIMCDFLDNIESASWLH